MLQQIFSHTPLWVWAILVFLISRGVQASRDRELPLRSAFILPLVMLALALQGIANAFGIAAATLLPWAIGALIGAAFAWSRGKGASLRVAPDRSSVFMRGSWAPLALMMAIFLTKYAVAVTLAIQPALHGSTVFVAMVCAVYGVFSGLFQGRVLRVLQLCRQVQQAATVAG